ncbi:b-box zinc finger domain-containing protein [Cystoisospora suis]|uniref:B-box zinc finger domain-containing protein n=1 Tax=Cystoisospora suis TaxID=483139 RepID=A0A2C6L4H1_9APIC|nr:b-box zinc finger domain-containing protein [Cystoisospora suis]
MVPVGYLLKQIQQGHPLEDFLQLCSITALACDHHPCEPVRYFCRTCVNPPTHCLCSECMLGREHRGHFLQKTYEAWRDISARIVHEEWMSNLAHSKVETEGLNRQFLKEKRLEWGRALYEDRQLLLGIGAQLREMIHTREQDLRSSLQQFLSRFSHEVDGFRREIHEKSQEFQTHLDRLRNEKKTLDPLVLIDCYRKNYASIQAFLQLHRDPENDLFSHLPKSRMSLLGHAAQVVEELCALSFEAREKLRIADGHYGETQEREKAEREAALKLREEEYRKLQRGKEEEEQQRQGAGDEDGEGKKDAGGKEGQEEEKEDPGKGKDRKKIKDTHETPGPPDDSDESSPDEAPF